MIKVDSLGNPIVKLSLTEQEVYDLQEEQVANLAAVIEKNVAIQRRIIAIKHEALLKRIAAEKFWEPKVGDLIYVPTRMSLGHGHDDISGGLATIKSVERHPERAARRMNDIFVSVLEVENNFNWRCLLDDQKKHLGRYRSEFAHPDPDDRPEFNDGHLDRNWL